MTLFGRDTITLPLDQYNYLIRTLQSLQSELGRQSESMQNLQNIIKALNDKVAELQNELAVKENARQTLLTEVELLQHDIKSKLSSPTNPDTDVVAAQNATIKLQADRIRSLEGDIEQYVKEQNQWEEHVKTLETKISQLQTENDFLYTQLAYK